MQIALVQFSSWDKVYYFNPNDLKLKQADWVVVTTEFGSEVGKIIGFKELSESELKEIEDLKPIDRTATTEAWEVVNTVNDRDKKSQALDFCRQAAKRHNLEIKIVDCHFSYDDRRLTIAFIADGRIDFRELVKDLARHFQKSIRLHQLGVRDEAKIDGDIGPCGRVLCCASYLKELGNVSSDLAEQQQIAHRGSDRLSGVCSRLKCCLAYEKDLYDKLAKKLPAIGTRVRTKHGRGEIIGWHVLKGSVDVKIDPEAGKEDDRPLIVEVPIKD